SRTVVLRAQRGPIVDRRGAALATSTATESLFVQPRSVGDPVRVAARLAPVIGLSEPEVHAALTSARPFVWLRRKLPPTIAEQVRTLREPGLGFLPEPLSGDILAMAIRPTFNPNTFLDVPSADHWRNRAVTDPFEPGSTFKAILAAAALEESVVRPDDRINAENGAITLAGTTIHDWKKYGWLTFAEVLQNSSNIGSIKVGLALGRERYHRYMKAFGFGATTGVGLAGES